MGIPAWLWFVIAAVAVAAGGTLLLVDRKRRGANNRERRRWATLRGWQFAEADQVLPTRWERGMLAQHSSPYATDIVAGTTFTSDGRRQVYVLDLEEGGRGVATLVALRCRRPVSAVLELWLPDVPVPQESGLDLLGPVGQRYAFVTDVATARPLLTSELTGAVDGAGEDVTVVWLENDWVVAALDIDEAVPERLEQLLQSLGDVADLVDPFDTDGEEPVESVPGEGAGN
ncbi:hypothetical protein GCM10027174_41890 [Salinifilum aidingensis]